MSIFLYLFLSNAEVLTTDRIFQSNIPIPIIIRLINQQPFATAQMKKPQLYHLINTLIQESKNSKQKQKEDPRHFVQNYYMRYLKKNKLLPINKNEKIKDLMKSFQYLDSYVDLSDIMIAIQEYVDKENKINEETNARSKSRCRKSKAKLKDANSHNKLLKKVQDMLRDSYQEGRYLELNGCTEIVQNMQNNCNQLNNVKYKNCPHSLTFHELMNQKYLEGKTYFNHKTPHWKDIMLTEPAPNDEIEQEEKHESGNNPWRLLQERQNRCRGIQNNDFSNWNDDDFNELEDLKNSYKVSGLGKKTASNLFSSSEMLHSAAAYLHLILEREHQKKWSLQKKGFDFGIRSKEKRSKIILEKSYQMLQNKHKTNIRSTCTQQSSDCLGILKEQRDLPQHFQSSENLSKQQEYRSKASLSKHQKLKSSKSSKLKSQNKFVKISIKTEPNCGQVTTRKTLRQKKISILNEKENVNNISEVQIFRIEKKRNEIIKKPRHTLPSPQDPKLVNATRQAQKQYLEERQEQNETLRDKFTFKKRKVKQRLLKKITKFVNDVEHAERNMIIDSKNCEKQLEKISEKMEFQFQSYKTEKVMSDDKALEGVRCALSKQSTGLKRYQR